MGSMGLLDRGAISPGPPRIPFDPGVDFEEQLRIVGR